MFLFTTGDLKPLRRPDNSLSQDRPIFHPLRDRKMSTSETDKVENSLTMQETNLQQLFSSLPINSLAANLVKAHRENRDTEDTLLNVLSSRLRELREAYATPEDQEI